MMLRSLQLAASLVLISCTATDLAAATPLKSARQLTPDQIGEFVTLSGHTQNFRARSDRQPYSFQLKDASGATIRVCAWPDILQTVSAWQTLSATGTSVTLTAEVADYNGALELHIQDGAEVHVQSAQPDPSSSDTTSSTLKTTSPVAPPPPVNSP